MPRNVPFWMTKLRQLWRLVRESHEVPLTGKSVRPTPVAKGDTAVTFIGHSSFLIRTGGYSLLIDPVFVKRLILLRRQRRPGVLVPDLPSVDAVLITHAHMDHLNRASLRAVVRSMRRRKLPAPIAIVPEGVEDLVDDLGFREVRSLRWWESTQIASSRCDLDTDAKSPGKNAAEFNSAKKTGSALTVTLTPARHWGARMFKDTHRGFGGYTLQTEDAPTVYHSGDTAYFNGFHEIGSRLRPEIALLPIGAYYPDSYRSVHTSPEEALRAFLDLGAQSMVPMHYNTFQLGRESMSEPLPRLLAAAQKAGVGDRVIALAEGETWTIPRSAAELQVESA